MPNIKKFSARTPRGFTVAGDTWRKVPLRDGHHKEQLLDPWGGSEGQQPKPADSSPYCTGFWLSQRQHFDEATTGLL